MHAKMQANIKFAACLLISALLVACDSSSNGKFKVGVLLPLTGDSAVYGVDCMNGAKLAFRGDPDVEVIYEDSKEDPQVAPFAFRKLASVDHVQAVLGSMFSITSLPVAPVAQQSGVVMLTPATSDENVPKTGDCIFSLYPRASVEGQLMASVIVKSGVKNVVMIYQNVQAALDICRAAEECLKKNGIAVKEVVMPDQTLDYSSVISTMGNPEAAFIVAYKDPLIRFVSKAKELEANAPGAKTRWFSQSTLYEPNAVKENAQALQGIVFSAPVFNEQNAAQEVKQFRAAYWEAYHSEPTVWSAFGYDGAKILLQAHKDSVQKKIPLSAAMKDVSLEAGLTGPTSFDKERRAIKPLVIMEVKDGVPVIIDANPKSVCQQ